MIDSDGYFNLERHRRSPPAGWASGAAAEVHVYYAPALVVANQQRSLLKLLQRQFGGRLRAARLTPRHRRLCWVWRLTNRRGLEAVAEHCRHLPSVGPKGRRLALLPQFYRLRERGAAEPSSPLHSQWRELLELFGR